MADDMGQCTSTKNPCKVSVRDLMNIITAPDNEKYKLLNRPYDQVFEGIFIGGESTAINEEELCQLGITHVLNAAKGTKPFSHVNTDAKFYKSGIVFLGVPATDILTFKINKYFKETSDFIASAIGTKRTGNKTGRVFVHCKEGISRSATLVIAYLVTYQDIHLTDALRAVRTKRKVCPNAGFLQQLIDYSRTLDHCY